MRHLKVITVFVSLIILASCSLSSAPGDNQAGSGLFHVDKEALDRGILRIHLPQPHPKYLSIRSPKGVWYVIQDSDESIKVIPQVDFDTTTDMNFKIAELRGVTWRESKKVTDLVFQSSGNYLIYFADNLETEPENTFSLQESIYFKRR
jgi:hypothetical protein